MFLDIYKLFELTEISKLKNKLRSNKCTCTSRRKNCEGELQDEKMKLKYFSFVESPRAFEVAWSIDKKEK